MLRGVVTRIAAFEWKNNSCAYDAVLMLTFLLHIKSLTRSSILAPLLHAASHADLLPKLQLALHLTVFLNSWRVNAAADALSSTSTDALTEKKNALIVRTAKVQMSRLDGCVIINVEPT